MTISVQLSGDINSKHASLGWKKTFDGHLGCHLVLGVMPKDASLVSIGFSIYIPASKKCHLRCHSVCMQLPTNASLAFFGFIMCYPLLDGHVEFWQSPFLYSFWILSFIRSILM